MLQGRNGKSELSCEQRAEVHSGLNSLVEGEGNNLFSIKERHVELESPDLVVLFHRVATALDTLQHAASSRIRT